MTLIDDMIANPKNYSQPDFDEVISKIQKLEGLKADKGIDEALVNLTITQLIILYKYEPSNLLRTLIRALKENPSIESLAYIHAQKLI